MVVCREGKHVFFVKRYAAVPVVFQLEPKQHVHRSARSGAQRSGLHAVQHYAAGGGFFAVKTHQVIVDLLHVLIDVFIIVFVAFLICILRDFYDV